jgi:hypothetical protein
MATVLLQAGTVPKVNSKGKRTASRPFTDSEVADQEAANARPFGAELTDRAAAATVGAAQALPSRRKYEITSLEDGKNPYQRPQPDAPGYEGYKKGGAVAPGRGFKAGGMVRRGYGKARGA